MVSVMDLEDTHCNIRGIYIFFFFFFLRRKSNPLRKQLLNYCQNTVGGNITSAGSINAAVYNSSHSDFSSTYCQVQRDGQELCRIRTNQRVHEQKKEMVQMQSLIHFCASISSLPPRCEDIEFSWSKALCPIARLVCI